MNTSMAFVLYIFSIVSCVTATSYTEHNNINDHDKDIYARDFSFVSDVPDDAYDNDNKVTVAIAASIGGVAGLVFLASLVYAFIRRKKLKASKKHQQLNNRDIGEETDLEIDNNHGNDDIGGFEMSNLPQHTQENMQYTNAYKPGENNFELPRHNSIAMPSPFAIDMPRYSAMNTPNPSEFNTPAHSAYNSPRHVAFDTGNDMYNNPRQLALMNRHNAANMTGQSAPVTPRQSAPATPGQSAPVTPRQSAPVTPRQSAPATPRYVP